MLRTKSYLIGALQQWAVGLTAEDLHFSDEFRITTSISANLPSGVEVWIDDPVLGPQVFEITVKQRRHI